MKCDNYKLLLDEIIHDNLYVSDIKDNYLDKLKEIIEYLKNSDDTINDLRTIILLRNNETAELYDEYINKIVIELNNDIKIEILNNQNKYEDIIRKDYIYVNIWNSLDDEIKSNYLVSKKKFSSIDTLLINESIKDTNPFCNDILDLILNNEILRKKIDPFTISLNYSYSLLMKININEFDLCSIFTKDTYTRLLLNKVSSFTEFVNLYESNKKLYNLLSNNGLNFDPEYNEEIYNFILDNPNFIGKFAKKYLDLFSVVEITKISKLKTLDSDAFSTILSKLYKYDKDKANELFNEENLKRCSKHSLDVYPFDDLSDDIKNLIFSNNNLFNRFIDTIMIEALDKLKQEDEILNILRNDVFVNDMSSYAIELLLNKLSFKSSYNMLQKMNILNKINHLNTSVSDKDILFVKGYLDSPSLVLKSDHNMLFDMLNLLSMEDVLYYIPLPYISNNLSNYEVVNLCINKNIDISNIISSDVLMNKLNITDIIFYIDEIWENKFDLNVLKNEKLFRMLFNIELNSIDIDEVNYLYENIRMKSILSKQESKPCISNYKSVLCSYIILGLDRTLKIVNEGNSNVTLNEVLNTKKIVLNEKLLKFKENNSSIFQNIGKKVSENLRNIGYVEDIIDFSNKLKKNTYLDNIIFLMLDNNFDNYKNITNNFYSFINYYDYNEYQSKKDMYEYTKKFTELYISNIQKEEEKKFDSIILNNFKPKENVLYSKRNEYGRNYILKLKLKLFIRSLTESDKSLYTNYFKAGFDITNLKTKYIKYIETEEVEFQNILEHVLIPLSNDRFDKTNCLNHLGIGKPDNYEVYYKYMNDLQIIAKLNNNLDYYKNLYDDQELISIMNYICYGSELIFKPRAKVKKDFDKLRDMVFELSNEIYIDKSAMKFIYNSNLDIYNIDEIIEYKNYNDILDDIVSKTYNYINRNMNSENIKKAYSNDYFRVINSYNYTFPISNKYYELKKRVFSLKDINTLFNGYDLNNNSRINDSLIEFLLKDNNLIMICDGYYNGIVDNLGIIISKWNEIYEYASNLNINNLDLIKVENILNLINFNNNILGKNIDKDIIKSICEDGYYEVQDLNVRINMLVDLYKESFKSICSTIPYLCVKNDNYVIKTIDKYDQDSLRVVNNSIYKVGSIGNDFLHYSLIDKNGCQIGIYHNENLIAKVIGARNGNTLYLNAIEGIEDDKYEDNLRLFANELIKVTENYVEPIEYVTIVNNELFNSKNGLKLETTICPNISYPISDCYQDYEDFKNFVNLLNPDDILHTNYADNFTTLLANSNIVDKNNFKYYDPQSIYYRKRNSVLKLSNNIGESYLNKIDTILYLCNEENSEISIDNIVLNDIDTIYLGDDFVLFVTNKNSILKYVLPYDERANDEIKLIIESLG